MATFIVGPNSRLYWQEHDLSASLKEGSVNIDVEALDKTAWGHATRVNRAGLYVVSMSASGHQEHDSASVLVDDALSADMGVDNSIVSIGSNVSAEGDILYSFQGLMAGYSPIQGSVGDLAGFGFSAEGSGRWFRGKLLADKSARTATGNSTGIQLGTIAATKNMHASLHIFAASGTNPTLDVTVESDDNSGFTSATTRLTFTQADSAGAEFLGPTAGPGGSDDYWRVAWTIGGSDPSFTFAVVFGHGSNG